jgi:hypothetical protein
MLLSEVMKRNEREGAFYEGDSVKPSSGEAGGD